jgi:hypothetical protein
LFQCWLTLRDQFPEQQLVCAILNAFLITYLFFYSWLGSRQARFPARTVAFFTWWSAAALTSLSTGPLSLGAFRSLITVGEAVLAVFAKAAATWVRSTGSLLACRVDSVSGDDHAPAGRGIVFTPELAGGI